MKGDPPPKKSRKTVALYLRESWLPSLAEDREANTIEYYRRGIDDICKHIGSTPLERVKADALEAMLRKIPAGSTRRRARKTISAALNKAVMLRLIRENPMTYVRVPDKCPPPNKDCYTPDEARMVLEYFYGKTIEAAVVLSILCGLRREEVMGLDWKDIDVKGGFVRISKAYVIADGKNVLKGTKTPDSMRSAPLVGYALERMIDLSKDRVGPVLVGKNGRMTPSGMTSTYKRGIKKLGIRYVPFANLRHTFASIALQSGVDIALLSVMLGHDSVATTFEYLVASGKQSEASKSVSAAIMQTKKVVKLDRSDASM